MSGTRKFALFLIYSGVAWMLFWIIKLAIDPSTLGASNRGSEIFTAVLYVFAGFVPMVFGFVVKAFDSEAEREAETSESQPIESESGD